MISTDGPGDLLGSGVRRPVPDEEPAVELADLVPPDPAGHHRDVVEIWVSGHGRHGGVQVQVLELGRQVIIEYPGELAVRHLISTASAVAEMPVAPDATLTGVNWLTVVPLPICPSLPPPQAYTSPVKVMPYEVLPLLASAP